MAKKAKKEMLELDEARARSDLKIRGDPNLGEKRNKTLTQPPRNQMKHASADVIKGLRMSFEEAISESLGVSVKEALIFHLRMRLGRDPFKVLWENPIAFYTELEMIFGGGGAKFLVKLFVDRVNKKFNLKHSPETFFKVPNSER